MKRRYDLVVFDWEGTLAEDSYGQVIHILAQEAQNFNILNFDKILARKYLPLGLITTISRLFPELSIHNQEKLLREFQRALQNPSDKIILTHDAKITVKNLYDSGIKLGIATNRSLNSLQKDLNLSSLAEYFKFIRTASQTRPKPCPDMLEEIIWESGSENSRTLMIGDSISDIEMAHALSVDAIGVDFYHEQQGAFLEAGACLEIDNYQSLLDFGFKSGDL
jgi:phosphoglycolate phosphatase